MLLAYLDEIGEPGAFVSKTHKRFNTSPAFGYAGFVVPAEATRPVGQVFTEEKRRLFRPEIDASRHPDQWERKGSDIFTRDAWSRYRHQIRVFRGLIQLIKKFGGQVFYYADEKEIGTNKQVHKSHADIEAGAMRESINRLCRLADGKRQNLLIMMDQVNESQRYARISTVYQHIFSRSRDHDDMKSIVEPPMHIDSALSSNIQLADWVATAIGRAIDHQLIEDSSFTWIPPALRETFAHTITHESKLHLWNKSVDDLYHIQIFNRERPLIDSTSHGLYSDRERARLTKALHRASSAQRRMR